MLRQKYRVFQEQSTGFPGYKSIIVEDKATIGGMLFNNGYANSWFGKDHNTPAFAASQVGPFDQWLTGTDFEYFCGFVGGDANYKPPFALNAELNKLTLKVDRPQLSPADIEKLKIAMRNNKSSG
ncbi:MAG: hypothetical protein WBM59_07490 [Sedimenticolaceae bacterium]|jgi:arylsulfatase A-like enzyme